MTESRHVSVVIAVAPEDVYRFAADPANLPVWAAGLAGGEVEPFGDHWATDSPMGRIEIRFQPPNDLGVLDHWVTLPAGEVVYNPMRVLPHKDGSEVVFTVRQRSMTDQELNRDAAAVAADLQSLKGIVEAR